MIEIIPAIDLIDGKCVRLTHGDFASEKIYSDEPLETAKRFESAGLKRLHVIDLDGAKIGKPKNLAVLELIAKGTNLTIDFGGGIKTRADLESVFSAGAAIANSGSIAAKEPETFLGWIDKYGKEEILLGADAKDGNIAIDGWQTETDLSIIDYLKNYTDRGVTAAFVTDIGCDGAMGGPSTALYRQIIESVPQIDLIASGGVSSLLNIEELEQIGCAGVIIGKAIYEGAIKLEELSQYAG
ncbi:MAG: 1-(5-phosphoribosyl)-5-[(5-phosphoribosylamino)methylideneamino]imidazole-4-carboxamide isomerase [Pyrinomonadaceae bacterium]